MNKWIHTKQKKTGRKKKLDEGKEGKATKPIDDMVYLKRDNGRIATQERPMKKWNATQEILMKNRKLFKKDRRKNE